MKEKIDIKHLRKDSASVLTLESFSPGIIDKKYLEKLGVKSNPYEEVIHKLENGSRLFIDRFKNEKLLSQSVGFMDKISLDEPLKHHRYTNACPIDAIEINPVVGCGSSCLYCLANNGDHSNPLIIYENYAEFLEKKLELEHNEPYYYYLSPKTEPFQGATLENGIVHKIMETFIKHFRKNKESKSKVYIISKAGSDQLLYKYKEKSVIDLMSEISDRIIFNTSISIMPEKIREILEPRSPLIEDRLKAVKLCQMKGIQADTAIVQPIIGPYYTDNDIHELFKRFNDFHITAFKPELLTLSIENLAVIGQIIGYFDKKKEKELYELYIAPKNIDNVKHNKRIAPNREYTRDLFMKLKKYADESKLTMNICNWVRNELKISEKEIPVSCRVHDFTRISACKI